jgi:hypothetical protein
MWPNLGPQDAAHPMTLAETRQIGNVILLRYLANSTTRRV